MQLKVRKAFRRHPCADCTFKCWPTCALTKLVWLLLAENVARKYFCQPVRLPTLSITSQVESKPLGTFLLAAKEVPKQQIRTGGGCVRASHAATAGCAASGHAPRAVRGSAAASVRAAVTHQALMAVRPNPHGGPRPVVATEGDVGWVCECGLCYFVAFCFRPGHNTSTGRIPR